MHLAVLPDDQRSAVDLSLNLLHNPSIHGGYDADRILSIAAGAVIAADAGAEVGLTSDTDIRVDGTIRAPAGKIALALTAPPSAIKAVYNPDQAISLGNTALLDAGGTLVLTANSLGLKLGQVLAGGTVSLTADRGYLLTAAAAGSTFPAAKLKSISSTPPAKPGRLSDRPAATSTSPPPKA